MSSNATQPFLSRPTGLNRISLPNYTLGEEVVNSISHGIGVVLGIVTLVLCAVRAALHHNPAGVVSGVLFGICLILLYSVSSIYHALKRNRAKQVFRILDHCSIFLLIAGTYTPFTLVTLPHEIGYAMFFAIWFFAILGIVLNAIDLQRFSIFSMICYLVMGWMIVLAFRPLCLPPAGIWLLLAGGLCYTAGTITFGLGSKIRYMHSIWHGFVLAGSILHVIAVLLYVM